NFGISHGGDAHWWATERRNEAAFRRCWRMPTSSSAMSCRMCLGLRVRPCLKRCWRTGRTLPNFLESTAIFAKRNLVFCAAIEIIENNFGQLATGQGPENPVRLPPSEGELNAYQP